MHKILSYDFDNKTNTVKGFVTKNPSPFRTQFQKNDHIYRSLDDKGIAVLKNSKKLDLWGFASKSFTNQTSMESDKIKTKRTNISFHAQLLVAERDY